MVTRYKGTNLHSTIILFQMFLYVSSPCKSRRVIYGEMALCYKGIDFAKQQLDSGDILNTFVNDDSDHDSNYDDDDSDDEMISENTTMDTYV